MDYQPLLIATSTNIGGTFSTDIVYNKPFDTKDRFNLWIKHNPFMSVPTQKNIITQSWKDEDGDDVFLPDTIYHVSDEIELEFIYFQPRNMQGEANPANVDIRAFLEEIQGRWLQIYDSYTGIGRQACYLIETDKDPHFWRRNYDYVSFKCKFKVNDPNTNITLKITD